MSGSDVGPITICADDPAWPAELEAERSRLRDLLGAAAAAIEHIGSTALPGLAPKPIIDIMVAIPGLCEAERTAVRRATYIRAVPRPLLGNGGHDATIQPTITRVLQFSWPIGAGGRNMTRQFPLWLVVASAALALAVSGCGSSSSTNISSTSGGAEQTTQTAAAATASASATPAVLAHLDPCTLITKADAQTVLGGVPAVNSDTGECVYDLSGSTFKRLAIQLGDKAVSADEFAAQANTLPGVCRTGGPSVSGAGDAAFESTDHTQLVVRKGARCFGLIVNPYDAAVRSTILTTILSRL